MNVAVGTRLAHYEITAAIGKGGMGEVFRAKDAKLGRDVAIKVLPEEFTRDPERLGRFEREARVLASLNHPNIAAIYGLDEADGTRFLALELAEGEDLSARLARGAIPVDEAIAIAVQIADALEAAHEKGIIHRDLKPANVKLSDDGRVKLLDFGLAKALDVEEGDPDLSNSPTMVRAATHAGVILGTAAYMSPEQARGKKVDRRADVWAFGVVLYEMLTGGRLFTGETVSDTLASVLTREVDFSKLPTATPSGVRWVLERCLERDAKLRLRDVGEARVALQKGTAPAATAASTEMRRPRRGTVAAVALLGLLLGAALGVAGVRLATRPEPTPLRKLDVRLQVGYLPEKAPTLSPDGRSVMLPTYDAITIRALDSTEPTVLPGTRDARFICWAPDSRQLAFVTRRKLWRVGLDGRPPIEIASLPEDVSGGGGLAWLDDDRIVIAGSAVTGLLSVPARGGAPMEIVPLDKGKDRDFHQVSALPDGKGMLVAVHPQGGIVNQLDLVRDGKRRTLLKVAAGRLEEPVYAPSGHILYSSEPGIWALPFSLEKLEVTGEPFLVASPGAGPSVASDGTIAYIRGTLLASRQMLLVDTGGRIVHELGRPLTECEYPDVSPDGERIVASMINGASYDLVLYELKTRTSTVLTKDVGTDFLPDWAPDGRSVVYEIADRDQVAVLSLHDPAREVKVITKGQEPRWWPDGRSIAFSRVGADGSFDLWRHRIDGSVDEPLLVTPANESAPAPAPDGGLIAYVSDETGRDEIFVFDPAAQGSKLQLTKNGGGAPQWSRDGKSISYQQGTVMMRVRRIDGAHVAFGEPERLFSFDEAGLSPYMRRWAAYPDGESFVALRDVSAGDKQAILTIVTNWTSEFDAKR